MNNNDRKKPLKENRNKNSQNSSQESKSIEKQHMLTNIKRYNSGSNWNKHISENHSNNPKETESNKQTSDSSTSQLSKSARRRQRRQQEIQLTINQANNAESSAHAPVVNKADQNVCIKANNVTRETIDEKLLVPTNISRNAAGSNWVKHSSDKDDDVKEVVLNKQNSESLNSQLSKSARQRRKRQAQRELYVAMDCEMVGIGPHGNDDMLARVSIVNKSGEVLLDKYVKPREKVVDYRTEISGIRPTDIENGEDITVVQDEVIEILQGKILVGHGIRKDLSVLYIKHPYKNIRDTSRYRPLSRLISNGRTPSLKRLSEEILGLKIQTGEHNSIEDARAAMNIYNRLSQDWEKYIQKRKYKTNSSHFY
ncbi:RNA exonuclease 4 [Teleopsis dalmanni]|uniref:RNA exonuclease 4 n=1 Tax=Teleopsis dalmanni TaxID=139649 RepID=UPI0018CCA606|nr:RNA exonuclease 4 [Teleopsis dalmanni]